MAKDNMGVLDTEFTSAGNAVVKYAQELCDMIDTYCAAVKTIGETGIQDQLIRSQLVRLTSDVANLKAPLMEIAAEAAKNCTDFVQAVDDADQFLY